MSGVYIKGMEMPKACVYRENGHLITCPLYDIDGYCGALNTEASHKETGKLSDCPLVPVPPHGRLGDLGNLRKKFENICDRYDAGILSEVVCMNMMLQAVISAPTIIPAEDSTDFFTAGHLHLGYAEEGE